MADVIKYKSKEISLRKVKRDVTKINSNEQSIELRNDTPSLVLIKKEIGEEKLIALLQLLIIDVIEFFNVKETMKDEHIEQTAMWILQDFKDIHLNELMFVFEQAKKGRYGEMYNLINGTKIYNWFENYWEYRLEYFENKHIATSGDRDPYERSSSTEEIAKIERQIKLGRKKK